MQKEHPILFTSPMIRAILDRRKTQTRRIIKPQPYQDGTWWKYDGTRPKAKKATGAISSTADPTQWTLLTNPYGRPGDHLWVKETFQTGNFAQNEPRGYVYLATDAEWEQTEGWKWRPSIHMPRAASRITLLITDIRVQRLHDITEADAIAEGVEVTGKKMYELPIYRDYFGDSLYGAGWSSAVRSFQSLWQLINCPESWDTNPWVWVIHFTPIPPTP